MPKALFVAVLVAVVALAGAGGILYLTNGAPSVAPVAADEAAASAKPFVVKLHAQWCVYCLVTKDVWNEIASTYADRVHLVVFDFTSEATTTASRAEAARLRLDDFYQEFEGVTGAVVVLDGRSKAVASEITGSRDFSEYRDAIDRALSR